MESAQKIYNELLNCAESVGFVSDWVEEKLWEAAEGIANDPRNNETFEE